MALNLWLLASALPTFTAETSELFPWTAVVLNGFLALAVVLAPPTAAGDGLALLICPLAVVLSSILVSTGGESRLAAGIGVLLYAAVAADSRARLRSATKGQLESNVEAVVARPVEHDRRRLRMRRRVITVLVGAAFAYAIAIPSLLRPEASGTAALAACASTALGGIALVVYGGPATRRRRRPRAFRSARFAWLLLVACLGMVVHVILAD